MLCVDSCDTGQQSFEGDFARLGNAACWSGVIYFGYIQINIFCAALYGFIWCGNDLVFCYKPRIGSTRRRQNASGFGSGSMEHDALQHGSYGELFSGPACRSFHRQACDAFPSDFDLDLTYTVRVCKNPI